MDCKQFNNGTTCNECIYDLLSKDFIQGKHILKISKIAASILWTKEFANTADVIQQVHTVNIKCNGDILIYIEEQNSENLHISIAQYVYCKLIKNWYDYYKVYKEYDSYKYIKERLKYISTCQHISKIRTEAISVTKYIEEIAICNGSCTRIIPDKEISKCKIPLSDMKRVGKLNSDGLVSILNTILSSTKDLSPSNLTVDLNTTYITCSGNVVIHNNFIKCKSTVADMESMYIYYLNYWCSANFNKVSEIEKIKENVLKVQETKTVHEIYVLSSELLDSLWA